MNRVELLAPAKNLECGIQAIIHGADAVYIGAPKYSARSAAGNTLEDIAQLVQFAHGYHARVFVALNTLLTDAQLAEAEQLIHQLYHIGVDALIVQDTGIFNLNLPPIALHASTQADNRTVEKVRFWQEVGCEQVVLARELSLAQIKEIASQTNVRLEAFVHGALCVSYSGQCYASQALCGRSANRGECAQICRLPFDLQDAQGHSFGKKHWLSLKDFDLSNHVGDMLDAGVRSFKIEGRLKEVEYVKNITAYYRQKIDAALATRPHLKRLSDGVSTYTFAPNPQKTFHRGATTYFFNGRNKDIFSFETPKSVGEYLGYVKRLLPKGFVLSYATPKVIERANKLGDNNTTAEIAIHNGDGLCFFTPDGELSGCKVNKVENGVIIPNAPVSLRVGDAVYRNADEQFLRLLQKPSASRKIQVTLDLEGDTLRISDGTHQTSLVLEGPFEKSNTPQTDNYKRVLSKLGDTIFEASDICIDTAFFIPSSVLTAARRAVCEALVLQRLNNQPAPLTLPVANHYPFPLQSDSYLNNIANQKARDFYAAHGAETSAPAFELQEPDGAVLMFCKHCIRYALGACAKENRGLRQAQSPISEPLFLIHKNYYLKLSFNCKDCVMEVRKG
ncbi:MAG: U32 family peptidase [Paludibacteraceae bacterium]|nr:U32 family peptidase [Paludibacteraceae bacterium]